MRPIRILHSLVVLTSILAGAACEGLPSIESPVRSSDGPLAVVANQDHGVATIVDLTEWRVVAHVDVKLDPHEAAASPDGRTVALTSPSTWFGEAQTVAVIDVRQPALVRSIDLGTFRWPHGVAFLDERTLAVSSRARGGILFVDPLSGNVSGSALARNSSPYLLHVAPATRRAYTTNPAVGTISEYDTTTRAFVRDIPVDDQPIGLAVSPDGGTLWVSLFAGEADGSIVVIDAATGTTRARLPVSKHARRLAFTGDGATVLASGILTGSLLAFDAASLTQTGQISLEKGAAPSGVACLAGTSKCYIPTLGSGDLLEVDVAALRVLRRIRVGTGADGIVLVPRRPLS